jgi:hypothetical protein
MHARIVGYLVLAVGLAAARRAFADDKLACVRAADAAQDQRTAGKLREARASLHVCAREVCPPLVRADCTQWLSEVEISMPTMVIRGQSARGEDLADVQVDLDGRRIADKLEGLPIEVDPGPHVLTWRSAGKVARQEIVVHTAEKNRTVTLRVEPVDALAVVPASGASTSENRFRPGAAAWIFAGVAVAGAASFGYFGMLGSSEVRDMRSECAGHCPASRVDAAREKLLVGDLSLGAAVVSAGIATYFFWSAARSAKAGPVREVSVSPVAGGWAALWVERF